MKKVLFVSIMTVALLVALVAAIEATSVPIYARSEMSGIVMPAGDHALAPTQLGTVTISISPSIITVETGETFDVDIQVDPQGYEVLGASVHLDYDPSALEVTGIDNGDLDFTVRSDSGGGSIDYEAANLGTWYTDTFVVATIHFNAKGSSGVSSITFVMSGPRETLVSYAAEQHHTVIPMDGMVVWRCPPWLTFNVVSPEAVVAGCQIAQNPPSPHMTMDVVELIANTLDPCWVFDHWSGDLTGGDNPVAITLDHFKIITAYFTVPTYTLAVNTVGDGSVVKDPDKAAYTCGEVVTLTAYAGANARFAGWSGHLIGSDNPATITIDSDKAITANFAECPCLPDWPEPEGGIVTVEDDNGDGFYDDGETITITATPDDCYEFTGWTGALFGEPNPAVVTFSWDLAFEATFQQPTYTLDVNLDPVEGGQVTLDLPSDVYTCGATITATATPTTSWAFDHWSGAATGSDNPIQFVLDEVSGTILNAHFMQYKFFLPTVLKKAPK